MGNVFSGGDKKSETSASTTRPSTSTTTTTGATAYRYNGVQTATSRPPASSTAYAHTYAGNTYSARPAAAPTANSRPPVITTFSASNRTVTLKDGEPIGYTVEGKDYTAAFMRMTPTERRTIANKIIEAAKANETATSAQWVSFDERKNLAKEARNGTAASTARPGPTSSSGSAYTTGTTSTANCPSDRVIYEYEDHSPFPPNKAATARPSTTASSSSAYSRGATASSNPFEGMVYQSYEDDGPVYKGFSRTTYDDPYGNGTLRGSTRQTTSSARPAAASTATPSRLPTSSSNNRTFTARPYVPKPAPVAKHPVFANDEDDVIMAAFGRLSLDDVEKGTPVYTLSVTDQRVCIFEPGRERFLEIARSSLSRLPFKEQDIYLANAVCRDGVDDLTAPTLLRTKQYILRDNFVYGSADTYRELILPALLLGSRVRDFEQRCAVVDQIGTIILTMPAQNRRLKELKLKTITGTLFTLGVKWVKKGKEEDLDKKWIVTCHPPTEPLPVEVQRGSMLEIMDSNQGQVRVTAALMGKYANKKTPIENWKLLSAIYGARAKRDYPAITPSNTPLRLAKNAGQVSLNPEQAEAVARYNCKQCPAFVVESPPGSGKTMTAAAMAVSYEGDGVQLFLSTANVPVINMALALAKLDIGSLKPIHFISSEREELMTDETRSPFSVLSLAKASSEDLQAKIEVLEEQMKHAPNEEEKEKLRTEIRKLCSRVYGDQYNVYFATVDMILGRLFKPGKRDSRDGIKKDLTTNVRRVVVDEASQLTEAALNALILCFPKAQIVLIGDSKQLPPFKYMQDDVVSALAARSALETIKGKMNLPVIKLTRVYRASHTLMAHYSHVFYEGCLISCKAETQKNLLSCFGARAGNNRCLFWKVKGHQKQLGTSKINDGEISQLKYLINLLRASNRDEKDVMIISYYEAQRKKAEDELPEGYEVLTVDSAQGREKKIVIVLTTRTSVPTDSGAFFSCPLRCNVAVSRHQEALIVLGHNAIASALNWSRVLSPKFFKHVEPHNAK